MKQVININGKEHPFALTFGALHRLKRDHGIANINKVFSDIEEGGFEPLCKVVYEGVKSGYGKENKEKDFTHSYDSFADTIDIKDMNILANAIVEAMTGKQETKQIEEGKAEDVSPNDTK
jgi:hypothetical protein